jgi:hypothetical protein
VPHGLRKNAVIALLEAGCSSPETAAISGQSLRVVEHYAKERDQSLMADSAVLKWQGTNRERSNRGKPSAWKGPLTLTPGKRDVSPISRGSAVFGRLDRKTGALPTERRDSAVENYSPQAAGFDEAAVDRWNDGALDGCRAIAPRSADADYLAGHAEGTESRKVRVVMVPRPEGYYHAPIGAFD